jgi:hypothetical protein
MRVLVRRSVISFDFCHERLVFGRSFEFMKFLVHVFVGLLELEDFPFEVLDIELVLLVFLVDFFLLFLEFFVLFSKVAPVDFQLKPLGLLLVAFVSDKFLEIFLWDLGFVKGDVALELMGFLLEFMEEEGLVGLELLFDDSFVLAE